MNNRNSTILIALLTAILGLAFVVFVINVFSESSALGEVGGTALGFGLYHSFVIVICTGIIVRKLNEFNKPNDPNDE